MPEQWNVFSQMIPCILAVELLVVSILQLRTNCLLKRAVKKRIEKKEAVKQWKEEVKTGASEIPVVQFEKKKQEPESKKAEKERNREYDEKELKVLQEMMAEFFG